MKIAEISYKRASIRNFINKKWQEISNQRCRDYDWSGFRNAIKYLQKALDERYGEDIIKINYYCIDGGYRQSKDGMSQWKEYLINIEFNEEDIIKGYINCCACGTISDPFSVYDMVFVNWLNNDKD